MNSKSSFVRGTVELLVLSLLAEEDCYGFLLVKKIKDKSDGIIDLSVGTLYPALYKMIEAGYITDYKKEAGKRRVNIYYHLEESGRKRYQELHDEYLQVDSAVRSIINAKK